MSVRADAISTVMSPILTLAVWCCDTDTMVQSAFSDVSVSVNFAASPMIVTSGDVVIRGIRAMMSRTMPPTK